LNDDKRNLDSQDLEPGDREETFSPLDWCLAAGCGCGGCLDPTGCLDAMSQGCIGCLHACLVKLGCSVIVLAGLIFLAVAVISSRFGG